MLNSHSKTEVSNNVLGIYALLALPLAIAELPIILYLPAFYAKEVGLSIGLVGLVLLIARLWDGLSDLIVGTLSDRTNSRLGRRKPWILFGAPLWMLSAWFLCNPPQQVGLLYLFLWAVLFYTAHTFVKVPYWSWGAELSSNYEERCKVTGFRESISLTGNILVAAAPVLLLPNDAPVRDVLFLISILLIVLIPLVVAPLSMVVTDYKPSITAPKFDAVKIARDLFKNGPLKRFLLAMACLYTSLGVINSVAIFLIDIGFGLPGSFFSLFFIEYVVAIVVAPLIVRLATEFGKHIVLTMTISLLLLLSISGFILPMANYSVVAVWMGAIGVVFSGLYILPASILADIVDYDTVISGEERTGTYMATLNLIFKLGLALGVGIAYGALDIIGFDAATSKHTAHDVVIIRTVFSSISPLLLVPAIFILWNFPITRQVQKDLREKIESNASFVNQDAKKGFY